MKPQIFKPKTIQLLLIITVLFLTACGCTKNNPQDQLPPATQTGENTFGCIYDGVVFTPKRYNGFTFISAPEIAISVLRSYRDTEHSSDKIKAFRREDVKNLLYIYVYIYQLSLKGVEEYNLKGALYEQSSKAPYHSYILCKAQSPTTGEWKQYGSFKNSGKIIVTREDAENLIYSGTFSGRLKEENGTEIIKITNGRFDINHKTLNPPITYPPTSYKN